MLLHACCGPCSLEPVRILREAGIEPVIYYANSNIHPAVEYERRLGTLRAWAATEQVDVTEGVYDANAWEQAAGRIGEAARERFGVITHEAQPYGVAPTEVASAAEQARQARCRACYRLRLKEATRFAADNGFSSLGTTLSVSPYQYTDIIREELERACETVGIDARFTDWRSSYNNATRRSREAGMYRQNYCGCRFSDEEAALEREQRKAARAAARAADEQAHAAERAAEEAERCRKRAEKQAYAEKQARKRAILRSLREQQRNQ